MAESHDSSIDTKNFSRVPILVVLLSGAFVAILNQTLLGTALPHMMADLDINANTVQWLQSAFMLVNGIMIPITAFLIGTFTTRSLFLTAMSLFTIGTLICGIAPEFFSLLTGRILQAAGAGIMMPLMQTILILIYPKEKRGSAMGMFGLVISFAPAIGPTLSGYIVENFPWRTLFFMVLPIAILNIIIAYFLLKNVTKRTFPELDKLSILLSTLGFGGILYGFSTAGNAGWLSYQVIGALVTGGIMLAWFITRQMHLKTPILEFRVFKYRVFTITTVLGMVTFMTMIGAAVILPLYMQQMLGFSAFHSGLALLAGAVVQGLMNPVTGRLFDRYGARYLAMIGLILIVGTTFALSTLTTETSFIFIATIHALRMLGVAMAMMPVTTAGLNVLPEKYISHGTAVNNTLRQVSGAIGTALPITIMSTASIPEQGIEGMVHGVNVSFLVTGIISIVALVLTFFIHDRDN